MIIKIYRVNGIHWGKCGPHKLMQAKLEPATDPGPWDSLLIDRGYNAGDIIEEHYNGPDCELSKCNGEIVYKYNQQKEILERTEIIKAGFQRDKIYHPLYNFKP